MKSVLIFSLSFIFLASCTSGYKEKESRLVDYDLGAVDSLSESDYLQLLGDLDDMFELICHKAECIADSGVSKEELRTYLKYDSIYRQIRTNAIAIDSLLTDYIMSGRATPGFQKDYKESTAKAVKMARKAGLY